MVKDYLEKNGWQKKACKKCNVPYWIKQTEKIETCQRISCLEGKLSFTKIISKKPEYKDIEETSKEFLTYFSNLGSKVVPPREILNPRETLFTIAGIQKFDEVIYDSAKVPLENYVFVQPCVRTKAIELVSKNIGYLSSFNMLCMEEFSTSPEGHTKQLNNWINYLDHSRIPVQTLSLVEKKWVGGKMSGPALVFLVGGLELGEIEHINISQDSREDLVLTDAGFSLERLMWLASKSDSPYDMIGPLEYSLKGEYQKMDLFRTLTLMSMQGLRPGNNKSEYLMRKMVNDNMGKMGDSSDLIDYYYNQWSKLIDPLIGKEEVKIILQEESNRAKNRALMKQFGINPSKQNLDVLYEQNLREFLLKKDWQDLKDNFK